MNKEEIKKAIENVEKINHSGSGRLTGIETEAANIKLQKNNVIADIIIRGPQEGRVRKIDGREYSYDFLSRYVRKNKE
ncbi:MAG: hypothetical protein H8E13_08085 [Actinobacteria bacterium]|nr:hypothetical protein [Actinomycetota bacterium]